MKNKKLEEIKDLIKRGFTLAAATALVVGTLTACDPEQPEIPDNDKDNEIVDTENPNENDNNQNDDDNQNEDMIDSIISSLPELSEKEQDEFMHSLINALMKKNPEYEKGIGNIVIIQNKNYSDNIYGESPYVVIVGIKNDNSFDYNRMHYFYISKEDGQALISCANKYFTVLPTNESNLVLTHSKKEGNDQIQFYQLLYSLSPELYSTGNESFVK